MEEERTISTLFLDIGEVLLTNGWDRASRKKAAEKFRLNYDELNERHHLTFDTFESGKLSLDQYLDRVVFHRERTFSRDDFKQFVFDQSRPYPEMIDLVKSIRTRHSLKVAVISNEGRELTEYRIEKFRLGEFIDFFVASCFVHIRKPDADIYNMALDIAQARATESLYIDDRAMFAKIAESIGIKSIHHVSYEKTRDSLAELGLSV